MLWESSVYQWLCRKHMNFAWGKYKKGIAMHKLFNLTMAMTGHDHTVSYESWHLQLKFDTLLMLMRLNFWLCEVAELARIQAKKNSFKNSKICNFSATKTLYTSKESCEQSFFQNWSQIFDFLLKIRKKKSLRFSKINVKKILDCNFLSFFFNICKKKFGTT